MNKVMKNNLKKINSNFCSICLLTIIIFAIINPLINKNPKDLNVYLNEEVCFADNVYIKVNKMAVYENKTINFLNDGNALSKYILHLNLSIQRRSEKTKNKPITINSNMFQLKNVN